MSQSVATAAFDTADGVRPAPRDPSVWARNLAALRTAAPELAADLEHVSLPDTWQPAFALDGFPTWRLEPPGEPPQWLGHTAAPLARAGGLLARAEFAPRNYALPCAAAGAELHLLLQRLPALLAVFVFETDIRVLAALLRLHDWSDPITRGRCTLVPPGREIAALDHLLATCPGLLPPAEILLPDLVAPARQDELRRIGEEVVRRCERQRVAELSQCQARFQAAPARLPPTPRLAVLSLTGDPGAGGAAAAIGAAAEALGWEATTLTVSDPRRMHPLVHVQALAAFQPDVALCINHGLSRLPVTPTASDRQRRRSYWDTGTTCVWVLDEAGLPPRAEWERVHCLAATPRIRAALEAAGVPTSAIRPWYWACDSAPTTDADAGTAADDEILLVADLPDTRPECCGITQVTHQQLWERLRSRVLRAWPTPQILHPDHLLTQAEREAQVALEDSALRQTFLRLTERLLIGAVITEQIARAVLNDAGRLLVLGRGWERSGLNNVTHVGSHWYDLPDDGPRLRPRACIFAGHHDPLHPALVRAAARGWPLLVHRPGGASLGAALGDVLHAGEHFEPFTDVGELRRALKSIRGTSSATRARAERARQHVVTSHTFQRRLEMLAEALRAGPVSTV